MRSRGLRLDKPAALPASGLSPLLPSFVSLSPLRVVLLNIALGERSTGRGRRRGRIAGRMKRKKTPLVKGTQVEEVKQLQEEEMPSCVCVYVCAALGFTSLLEFVPLCVLLSSVSFFLCVWLVLWCRRDKQRKTNSCQCVTVFL
jgi:hypothetical protein